MEEIRSNASEASTLPAKYTLQLFKKTICHGYSYSFSVLT